MNKWPMVPLEKLATPIERPEVPTPGKNYKQVGVKLWGEGAYQRESIDGGETKYKTLSRVEADDIIVNKIWARNGSVALIPKGLEGSYVSGEFPTFTPIRQELEPRWFHWITKTHFFWDQCDEKSRGTSGKNRIRPERFLKIRIPLPPLPEQQRIVAQIEDLANKIEKAKGIRVENETAQNDLLLSTYFKISRNAPHRPMREVAPLFRRPEVVNLKAEYPQIAVRSFGKGTFHKPLLSGSEITWQKPYLVKAGDILISNIKAWEGAIAVAENEDDGRFGSHRYLTCTPISGIATARFVCFHLLTLKGLHDIGEASPGSADRNRTLNTKALLEITIPIPSYEKQIWFDELLEKVDQQKKIGAETTVELDALLPSILDKAFKGEL
jgi:type I restriction enzyme S subunit